MKKLWILLLLPFLIAASPPTRQNTYVSSTTIRAADVTVNEDELFGYLQSGVQILATDAVDSITEIKSTLKTGSDATLVTGSEGSTNQMAIWNVDGDLVEATGVSFTPLTVEMVISNGSLSVLQLYVTGTTPGSSAGTDLCIGSDDRICKCNSCN